MLIIRFIIIVEASGLSNYYYYVGSGTAPYVAANNGTNEIPPHQGFFVHATTNNGTFGVNNNRADS